MNISCSKRDEEFMIRAYKGGTKKATHKSTLRYWKSYLAVKESFPCRCFLIFLVGNCCMYACNALNLFLGWKSEELKFKCVVSKYLIASSSFLCRKSVDDDPPLNNSGLPVHSQTGSPEHSDQSKGHFLSPFILAFQHVIRINFLLRTPLLA